MKNIKRKIGSMLIENAMLSRDGVIYRAFSKRKIEESVTKEEGGSSVYKSMLSPNKPISLLINRGIFNKPDALKTQAKITILIPFYSNLEGVYNLVLSIFTNEDLCKTSFKILIVNDNPDFSDLLQELMDIDEITVLNNPKNLGFLLNVNNAVKTIDSDYIFLLNDDVLFLTPCIDLLKDIIESNGNIAFASPLVMDLDGRVKEFGGGLANSGEAYHHERGNILTSVGTRRVAYASGCSLFFKTSTWLDLGGADEIFSPGYYEDASICLSAFEKNKAFTAVTSVAKIYHQEGVTHGVSTSSGIKSYQVSNQVLFQKKHNKSFKTGFLSDRFLTDSYTSTVLFIDSLLPANDLDSGSQDTYFQLKEFVNLNCKVFFYAFDDPRSSEDNPRAKYIHQLASENIEVIYNNNFVDFKDFFRKFNINPNIVVLSRMTVADKCLRSVNKIWPDAKTIFNTVDIHSMRLARESGLDATTVNMIKYGWKTEAKLILDTDFCWVVSEYEQSFIKEHLGVQPYLSMVKNFENIGSNNKDRNGLVFVGSGMHTPNIRAVDLLINLEMSVNLEYSIDIIGSDQDHLINNLKEDYQNSSLNFIGHVSDIRAKLSEYKVGIAILSEGAGVKGKILDYLASGCYVLANDIAVEGINEEILEYIDVVRNDCEVEGKVKEIYARENRPDNEIEKIIGLLDKYFGKVKFRKMIQKTLTNN